MLVGSWEEEACPLFRPDRLQHHPIRRLPLQDLRDIIHTRPPTLVARFRRPWSRTTGLPIIRSYENLPSLVQNGAPMAVDPSSTNFLTAAPKSGSVHFRRYSYLPECLHCSISVSEELRQTILLEAPPRKPIKLSFVTRSSTLSVSPVTRLESKVRRTCSAASGRSSLPRGPIVPSSLSLRRFVPLPSSLSALSPFCSITLRFHFNTIGFTASSRKPRVVATPLLVL
ncbi:hypothetical protein M407DRAFT_119873 [Tulasnella calospora MUT 4182]|uniref:Uncharacterized protein n=1 Tax=Tulasnella calospora MUT 4182 TaxID=1051891 RepID=A0A0C3LLE1_9AGAM|nr:hypothetical protein M407DRAFT_119873 [Tulasnella calospora MUT 4182]